MSVTRDPLSRPGRSLRLSLLAAIVALCLSPPSQPATSAGLVTTGLLEARRICLDPGHDARYTPGASAHIPGGVLNEHDLTLQVAQRVRELLQAEGADVCLTRDDYGEPNIEPYDYNGNGTIRRTEDLPEVIQPRTDWMNAHGAEIVLSIHFNGHPNPAVSGSEAYYSDAGPCWQQPVAAGGSLSPVEGSGWGEVCQSDNNYALAQAVLTHLLAHITAAGYAPIDRGLHADAYKTEYLRFAHLYGYDASCYDCKRLLGLGNNPLSLNRGQWQAGALIEVLFLSNPQDLAFLLQPEAPEVIAQGLAQGIIAYATSP